VDIGMRANIICKPADVEQESFVDLLFAAYAEIDKGRSKSTKTIPHSEFTKAMMWFHRPTHEFSKPQSGE
jgi:hypothetical protein